MSWWLSLASLGVDKYKEHQGFIDDRRDLEKAAAALDVERDGLQRQIDDERARLAQPVTLYGNRPIITRPGAYNKYLRR